MPGACQLMRPFWTRSVRSIERGLVENGRLRGRLTLPRRRHGRSGFHDPRRGDGHQLAGLGALRRVDGVRDRPVEGVASSHVDAAVLQLLRREAGARPRVGRPHRPCGAHGHGHLDAESVGFVQDLSEDRRAAPRTPTRWQRTRSPPRRNRRWRWRRSPGRLRRRPAGPATTSASPACTSHAGFLNSAAVKPPASAPRVDVGDGAPESEACAFAPGGSADCDAWGATMSTAVSSAKPPVPATRAARRRLGRLRRRAIRPFATASPPRPAGRTPANAMSSSRWRNCARQSPPSLVPTERMGRL